MKEILEELEKRRAQARLGGGHKRNCAAGRIRRSMPTRISPSPLRQVASTETVQVLCRAGIAISRACRAPGSGPCAPATSSPMRDRTRRR